MQNGKSIPVSCLIAASFWAAAVILLGAEFTVLLLDDFRWIYVIGHASLICGMIAGTLTVRGYLEKLADRERASFDMGREVGRSEVPRDLRSIS